MPSTLSCLPRHAQASTSEKPVEFSFRRVEPCSFALAVRRGGCRHASNNAYRTIKGPSPVRVSVVDFEGVRRSSTFDHRNTYAKNAAALRSPRSVQRGVPGTTATVFLRPCCFFATPSAVQAAVIAVPGRRKSVEQAAPDGHLPSNVAGEQGGTTQCSAPLEPTPTQSDCMQSTTLSSKLILPTTFIQGPTSPGSFQVFCPQPRGVCMYVWKGSFPAAFCKKGGSTELTAVMRVLFFSLLPSWTCHTHTPLEAST